MPEFPKSIKHPYQLLQHSRGALKAVFKQSQVLLAIQATVNEVLNSGTGKIDGDIQVAAFHKGLLHLITPSAVVATRIKYSQKALIAALKQRKNPYIVKNFKISVRPQFHKKLELTSSAIPISAESARHIATVAKYIEDEPLRKALFKLSQRSSSQKERSDP